MGVPDVQVKLLTLATTATLLLVLPVARPPPRRVLLTRHACILDALENF